MISVKLDIGIEDADELIRFLDEHDVQGPLRVVYNYAILAREQAIRGAVKDRINDFLPADWKL